MPCVIFSVEKGDGKEEGSTLRGKTQMGSFVSDYLVCVYMLCVCMCVHMFICFVPHSFAGSVLIFLKEWLTFGHFDVKFLCVDLLRQNFSTFTHDYIWKLFTLMQ